MKTAFGAALAGGALLAASNTVGNAIAGAGDERKSPESKAAADGAAAAAEENPGGSVVFATVRSVLASTVRLAMGIAGSMLMLDALFTGGEETRRKARQAMDWVQGRNSSQGWRR